MTVTDLGNGRLKVEQDGRSLIVYVAGSPGQRWAFCNGTVIREGALTTQPAARRGRPGGQKQLTSPMPATVLQVLVGPGSSVTRGQALVILEAMKMEMPLRAPDDAVVRKVHCRAGELVQPDAVLVELE